MLTTHLRARALQAGALLAVVVGGIVVAPGVALAAEPEVQITNLQTEVLAGGTVNMQYQVRNGDDDGQAVATLRVSGDMRCSGEDCGRITPVDQNGRTFNVQLTAPNVEAGETREVRVEVTVAFGPGNGNSASADQTIRVRGQERPQQVRQVSGRVKDQDGKAVSGAAVGILDSQGNQHQATSNGSGGFSFTSSEGKPIAPGSVRVGASKDDYKPAQVQIQAAAGRSVTVSLTLKEEAVPQSASPSASASASASAEPTEDAASEPAVEETPAAGTGEQNNAANSEDSGSSLIYIVGALLLAAGIGAIVLLFLRRRNAAAGTGTDDDDPTGLGGGAGVVPPSQGRFNDATRVGAPMGAGAAAATMVAPLSGAPSLADAPTMLHRPVPAVEDEFPDPYGVPIPQQGGYAGTGGATAGGWDDQADGYAAGAAYGAPAQYGQPADEGYGQGDGYGATPGAYGDQGGYGAAPAEPQRRYDEPTGMYRPEQDAGYDNYDAGQQYGGAQQQYGGGYVEPEHAAGQAGGTYGGGWGAPGDGIDNGNAYGPQHGTPQPGGGEYGAAPAAGGQYAGGQGGQYGSAGGYGDAAAYPDERGVYGADQGVYGGGAAAAAPAAGAGTYGGYDQQQPADDQYDEQTGYDQQRGTYGTGTPPPPQEPTHPGQRRSNEWGT